ncbi:MAG: 4a-hydroxytetrahydrobiopterin dehydratase [Acidobacteria bacterium]|nr:4a-hydroxytetrahydrobiopterin dehydratase [Acidobacteriota bacterium]
MSGLDDIRSDLKSERIQLKSERIQKKLEILVGWHLEGGEDSEHAEHAADAENAEAEHSALCKTYTLASPRAAMVFARYVAQVAEDLGREPDLHIQGRVVEVRNCSEFEDGTTGVAEADLDLALVLNPAGE